MAATIYPTVPVAQPEAEPRPTDEHSIRVDEMFARQLDTEFASGVRGLLHDPETGLSALKGEAALEAIAGAPVTLHELKERTLAQAIGPRQRSILEPMIETRLDWATGTISQLAQRATVEVDDQSVAERLAGLSQDASSSWRDRAHLRKLGRTAVNELRYQGERRGWEVAETDAKVRGGLSDLYAGAVEAAIGQDDLDGAAALYEHARPVLDPERQAAIDQRFVRAREVALCRDIDGDLSGLPLDPAAPPDLEAFQRRAAELVPEGASDTVRAGIAQVAASAHRHAERQWHRKQAEAGLAVLDWFRKNPEASFLAIPMEVRDWLAPDQWQGVESLYARGRPATDRDLFERLDRQMVHEPEAFAAVDLDRHRLSLGDADYTRFAAAQQAIAEGRIDPDLARYGRARLDADRALEAKGIDTDGPEAVSVHAEIRDELDSFEIIEGRPPNGEDIDGIVVQAVDRSVGDEVPVSVVLGEAFNPEHIFLAQAGGGGARGGGASGRGPQLPQRPSPGPGQSRPPQEVPPGLPSVIENWRRRSQPAVTPPPPDTAGPRSAAEQGAESPTEEPKAEERPKPFGAVEEALEKASPAGNEAFHYTFEVVKESILKTGLRRGSYLTTTGELSPLQAHIDLALSPNRGLPDVILRIDLNGLRAAGYEIPKPTPVARSNNMPGGGYEMRFPYPINPQFITVIK